MKFGEHKILTRLLTPRYNELALYLMSIAFMLLFMSDADLRTMVRDYIIVELELAGMIGISIFVSGMFYSLYHVFTTNEKTEWEKTAMLFFAVIVNSAGGIAAGVHVFKESQGLLMVFPLWNILNGILLLYMYRAKMFDETCIVDDNAPPLQVVIGTIVVVAAILVCTVVFNMYWATTFSICISYASNVNGLIQSIIRHPNLP